MIIFDYTVARGVWADSERRGERGGWGREFNENGESLDFLAARRKVEMKSNKPFTEAIKAQKGE